MKSMIAFKAQVRDDYRRALIIEGDELAAKRAVSKQHELAMRDLEEIVAEVPA